MPIIINWQKFYFICFLTTAVILNCHVIVMLLCFTSDILFNSFSQLAEMKQKILNKITTTPQQNISFFRFCVKIIICLKNNFAITVNLFKHKKKCSQYKTHNSPSQWEWLLLHFLPFNIFYDHNSWIKIFLIRQTIFFFFFSWSRILNNLAAGFPSFIAYPCLVLLLQ